MSEPKFQLERVQGTPVSTDEILSDIRSVAEQAGTKTVPHKLYSKLGKYSPGTASARFGTWNKALIAAGLEISNEFNIPDERLFENLMLLWEHFGRQPRRAQLARPLPSSQRDHTVGGLGRGHRRSRSLLSLRMRKRECRQAPKRWQPVTGHLAILLFDCGFA
jgi:hypothetical protein